MSDAITPMAILHLLVALGIARHWWMHKECRRSLRWIAIPFFLLALLHTWPVCYLALRSLEGPYSYSETVPPDAEAIVVLSGHVQSVGEVFTKPTLGLNTLDRCALAGTLHREAPDRLILVSGGRIVGDDQPSAASMMRDYFVANGISEKNIVLEERSRNTYENGVECARLLRDRGIRRIVLVTTAMHMTRSIGVFHKQGIEVIPRPCGFMATGYRVNWRDILPDGFCAHQIHWIAHEWIGIAYYRLRGRL